MIGISRQLELVDEQVHDIYRYLLRREPDDEGLQYWTRFRLGGGSYEKMIERFMNSAEFRRRLRMAEEPRLRIKKNNSTGGMWTATDVPPGDYAVIGNCQMAQTARCIQALVGGRMPALRWIYPETLKGSESERKDLEKFFDQHKHVFAQPAMWNAVSKKYPELNCGAIKDKLVLFPVINFLAFHPDSVYVRVTSSDTWKVGPAMHYHSSIALLAWKAGLGIADTLALYREDVFERLGFFNYWDVSATVLLEEGRAAGIPLENFLATWSKGSSFMHTINHPKPFVIADIVKLLLERRGIETIPGDPLRFVHDSLGDFVVWPVYPEVARHLGMSEIGSFTFKLEAPDVIPDSPIHTLQLEEFVIQSFMAYSQHATDDLQCERFDQPGYLELLDELRRNKGSASKVRLSQAGDFARAPRVDVKPVNTGMTHPYRDLPNHRFWDRAISSVACEQVDPVLNTKFQIGSETRIATAGSCFAQHISKNLHARGFHHLITEHAPATFTAEQAFERHYGDFSARFGYIYTARQLLQLFQRATGDFAPVESAWRSNDGRYVDPFRPRIEPLGFQSIEELEASRSEHLTAVKRMFETLDMFVFTLGLSEAWRSKVDGSVFPLAPGVAGGEMNFESYEFVNFTAAEVSADLEIFIAQLSSVNPAAKLILTVSPVPLVATYANRHVLVSNTYSKSLLRVAAEQVSQHHSHCEYFPSYEIITGGFNRGAYFESDLRSVTELGVDHVMRLFFQHYARSPENRSLDDTQRLAEARANVLRLCDEELLAATSL